MCNQISPPFFVSSSKFNFSENATNPYPSSAPLTSVDFEGLMKITNKEFRFYPPTFPCGVHI